MKWYKTPWYVRAIYPNCHFNVSNSAGIYLTFDDGPDPEVTPWVLDLLENAGGKATFFVVGKQAEKHPELVKETMNAGHSVGNHTYSHIKGWKADTDAYVTDVRRLENQLVHLGATRKLFRPPYGRVKKSQLSLLKDYETFFWSHLSWDFASNCKQEASIHKLKDAPPGSIILFHDTRFASANLKQILPELISHYQNRNLKLLAL